MAVNLQLRRFPGNLAPPNSAVYPISCPRDYLLVHQNPNPIQAPGSMRLLPLLFAPRGPSLMAGPTQGQPAGYSSPWR